MLTLRLATLVAPLTLRPLLRSLRALVSPRLRLTPASVVSMWAAVAPPL
jgi:hypothetical protein